MGVRGRSSMSWGIAACLLAASAATAEAQRPQDPSKPVPRVYGEQESVEVDEAPRTGARSGEEIEQGAPADAQPTQGAKRGPEGIAQDAALVSPTQGDDALRDLIGERAEAAIRRALTSHGYVTSPRDSMLGTALVACETPECMDQVLSAAGAEFGVVPAVWTRTRDGEKELTITLIERSGRTINLEGTVDANNTTAIVASRLIEEALAQRGVEPIIGDPVAEAAAKSSESKQRQYWIAGPILLIAAGAGMGVAVGIAAAQDGCSERRGDQCVERTELNRTVAIALSAVGAAAVAGGVAWWVIGAKRRKRASKDTKGPAASTTRVGVSPTGVHFRMQY